MPVSLSLLAGAGWQFFDNSGTPLSGGKLYTYVAGTTTPATTYTDATGVQANTNPIILNSAGRVPYEIWLTSGTNYKFVLKTSTDTLLGTYDNIRSAATSLDGTGTNNGVAYFNATGAFSSSPNFTFNDSTNALTVAGNISGNNISASGSIAATGNLSGVNLTATGTAAITGNTTITGTLAVTGGITSATPAVTQATGDNSTKIATTAFVQAAGQTSKIQPLTASINNTTKELIVSLAPTSLNFRSPTLTDGTLTTLSNSASISLTLPSSGSLGATSNVSVRLVILAVKNGSNMELAITNVDNGLQLDEASTITTSSAAATSLTSVYCASNLTTVYRVVGFVDATYITSIGWSILSRVQGTGGQALAALSSIGYGQKWYEVLTLSPGPRVAGTTYYNTTGRPIQVVIKYNVLGGSTGGTTRLVIDNIDAVYAYAIQQVDPIISAIIPTSASYRFEYVSGQVINSITNWTELR